MAKNKQRRRERVEALAEVWEQQDPNATHELVDAETTKKLNEGIDHALGLISISIRLQPKLVDDLQRLAKRDCIEEQAFIRQILTSYVDEQIDDKKH